MSRKVLCDRERFSPIRLLWQLNDENSDFIVYTQQYCKMEHGAAIYYIRPDVPFQYIPLEVLYPVVREGFARMGMTREEYEPNVTALAEIHQARMTNMMRRRRPTYIVLNKAAMEEFVRTGRQSDHLHFLRNFTPKERKQILDVLVQQARENPFSTSILRRRSCRAPWAKSRCMTGARSSPCHPAADTTCALTTGKAALPIRLFCAHTSSFT